MEYISAKEFLKQPKEVQKVFIDWWKCDTGDLFTFDGVDDRDLNILQTIGSENQATMTKANKDESRIPLFVEGQLRKFIEDRAGSKLAIIEFDYDHYNIVLRSNNKAYITEEYDLLQAHWKVALEIAKEKVQVWKE
ncbi:hypothetical protein B0P06_005301 [Clostridium saccharoperbutylacetonicum]|uniref:Uncharacterized protein n=1 Tax=Clostridium saccharoperbutylacetonicum N1-4(HMT) TaxID=931276 RepID=M1MJD3_9CLOT|nr:hypothetical protein [Clostridium saccharoperbutylacetonicum]AGF56433.1 hypothetical protein Cspa_c26680 [Clostridium saccharoperbutylacetonicum N1-4(HMT)]NRT62822.1 hypothetical protein [Clostridium saccharoperbutylacetonicum]NSB26176.1 hypothetical protein [Clostridium saccharoperbutylacetonicum]NSB45530.1 hypothetical protein [Clostridium saccharoperbutylacetonicum]